METLAVLDFETTGLSPQQGARPTEIAVVILRDGQIVDRYQSLMNAGVRIPWEIQQLTGITNDMVRGAPRVERVMAEAAEFVGDYPIVAHNASFDRKFWEMELAGLRRPCRQDFICSLLLARRIYPDASSHRLGTLAQMLSLPDAGRFHRALADAETTANLMIQMQRELMQRFDLPSVRTDLLASIQRVSKAQLHQCVQRYCQGTTAATRGVRPRPL